MAKSLLRTEEKTLKYIIAIVKPQKLDAVREALADIGVQGMTVSDVRGFGRQRGHKEVYRGAEYSVDFVPKIKLEIAVGSDLVDRTVVAIKDAAQSGSIGDGKVFILDLEQAVRVRTGEAGDVAI